MNNRESPLYWSFPCGTWFLTEVRVSVYFPVLVIVLALQLDGDIQLALVFTGILLLSVLAHEFGHVVAARLSGGIGNEILIWPLGGLAFVHPGGTFQSQLLTPAAGPLVNALLCLVTLPAVLNSPQTDSALNPVVFPAVELSDPVLPALLVLTFTANWMLLLINLVPVYPLDGGRMLLAVLKTRWSSDAATEFYLRVGFFTAFAVMFAGLIVESHWLVFVGAIVLLLNVQESYQMQTADAYDDSFMGYDFSQGYTSLERSEPAASEHQSPGFFKRWLERRRAEKERRQREKAAEAERQLDALLQKVHLEGFEALSESERRLLNRVSARYRQKGRDS